LGRADLEDYSARKPDAIIYIDTTGMNETVKNGAGVPGTIVKEGPCKKFISRPGLGREVCGANGRTYPNANYLRCYNRRVPAEKRESYSIILASIFLALIIFYATFKC
jgi:hypothetical protein